jgi:hypothetical protein
MKSLLAAQEHLFPNVFSSMSRALQPLMSVKAPTQEALLSASVFTEKPHAMKPLRHTLGPKTEDLDVSFASVEAAEPKPEAKAEDEDEDEL